MDKVIFACVHNAGRSQMAAAFFNQLADPARAAAVSAGTRPGERIHPVVVDVMNEVGINLSNEKPQRLTEGLAHDAALLVTMGCGDECPLVAGLKVEDWPLQDPKDQPVEVVRRIRDDIKSRVAALVVSRGWSGHSEGSP
jgi:arsenate reductase (thioredoxin)